MKKLMLMMTVLLLLAYFSTALASLPEKDMHDAEHIAQTYMTAFYHGDAMAAASQLLPESLENIKTTILDELQKAKKAGKTKELLNQLGFEVDATSLSKMNSREVYAEIIKSNHKKAGKAASLAMKAATVESVKSDLIEPNKIQVSLRIRIPKNGQFITQNSSLSLQKYLGTWKVVPD
jgi:hypothetical protein